MVIQPENMETSCFISFQANLIYAAEYLLAVILLLPHQAIGIYPLTISFYGGYTQGCALSLSLSLTQNCQEKKQDEFFCDD